MAISCAYHSTPPCLWVYSFTLPCLWVYRWRRVITLRHPVYINDMIQYLRMIYTGWRRVMGCLKLQVVFRKRATMYRALCIRWYNTIHQMNVMIWYHPFIQHVVASYVACYVACYVALMNESCHTHRRVMRHLWMGHGTLTNESSHRYQWVWSHLWTSRGTQTRT